MDRLAVQESLSDAARQRRKWSREDETAELDDAVDVARSCTALRRDDDVGGDDDGAGDGGSLSI
jgi:hypothetical protein